MQFKTRSAIHGSAAAETQSLSLQPMEQAGDPHYAPTEPMPLAGPKAPRLPELGGLSLEPVAVSLYEALAEIRRNNRVCPLPTRWLEFYRVLQESAPGRKLPAPPLSGSAWAATPSLAKRACLRQQLEWADANGCLQPAYEFIKSVSDSDWHYMG